MRSTWNWHRPGGSRPTRRRRLRASNNSASASRPRSSRERRNSRTESRIPPMRGESRQRFSAGALLGLALLFVATLGPATPTAATGVARVTLTAEGQPVAALYWSGPKGSGKAPAVILLHMLGRSKEDWQSFGDILERSGYAAIGANGALLFAAEEPRVRCAVLLSPGLDYHGVTTEAAIAQMKRPVLLVASEEDEYSAQSARRLERLAPGPKAKIG